jgi:DNA-binding CsgD family transcriptional regulator
MAIIVTNKMERDIPIRELNTEEVEVTCYIAKIVYHKNLARTQDYARDELMSFLNEEAYYLACKWDQKGDMKNLGGYLYKYLTLLCKDYRRNAYYHDSHMLAERDKNNDGEEAQSVWDKLSIEDDLSINSVHMYEKGLNDRQKRIMWMLYEGIEMKDIASELGLASRTIRKEKANIRDILKDNQFKGIGEGYYKSKRGRTLPNMKGGN